MGSPYSKNTISSSQPIINGVSNEITKAEEKLLNTPYTEQVQGNLNIINQIKDYEKEFNEIYLNMTDTLKLEKLAPCRDISLEIVSCFNDSDGHKYADCGKLMDSYVQCINNAKKAILKENKPNNNTPNNIDHDNDDNKQCDCCKN